MGAYFVDALRNEIPDSGGWRYYANGADGEKVVVRYSWMTRVPDYVDMDYGDPRASFEPLDASARAVVIKAMDMISAVCGVTFAQADAAAEADLQIGSWNIPGDIAGYAYYPIWDAWSDSRYNVSELWLDTEWGGVGSLSTALHEIGHTLGLEHPFEGDLQLPENEDLSANTVMSYSHDIDPQKLGLFDVIALQSIYGPAAKRRGDNTYIFGEDKLIWDGGGYDRIDASGAAAKVTLSLQDGSWNYVGSKSGSLLAKGQVWLGDFSLIEGAKGSRFGDRLTGNALNNRLEGNDGNDVLSGGEGNDRLSGGSGADKLKGGLGWDNLKGGLGWDKLNGGSGKDHLYGGKDTAGDDFIFTSDWHSKVGSNHDVVYNFTRGLDDIDLRGIDAQPSSDADNAFSWGGRTAGAHKVWWEATANGVLLRADTTGNTAADFEVLLQGLTGFGSGDVLL